MPLGLRALLLWSVISVVVGLLVGRLMAIGSTKTPSPVPVGTQAHTAA